MVGGKSLPVHVSWNYTSLTVCTKAWVPQRQPEDIRWELSNRVRELWNRNRQNAQRQEYTTVADSPRTY